MLPIVAPAIRADVLVERLWWLLGAVREREVVAVVALAVVEAVAFLMIRGARLGLVHDWGKAPLDVEWNPVSQKYIVGTT